MSSFNQKLDQAIRTGRAQRLAALRRKCRINSLKAKKHEVRTDHTSERKMKAAVHVATSPLCLTEIDRVALLEAGHTEFLNGQCHD